MQSIASRSGVTDTARLALLVGLHLADRLRAEQREKSELRAEIDDRTRRVSTLLDRLTEA